MATSQTVKFLIDIPYMAQDNTVQLRKYGLTLSLSMVEGEDGCGEISFNGAVMPVDDQPKTLEEPKVDEAPQGSDSMKEAA